MENFYWHYVHKISECLENYCGNNISLTFGNFIMLTQAQEFVLTTDVFLA